MHQDGSSFSIANILIKSSLIQAQSLEIFISQLKLDAQNKSDFLKLADIFEDIGNLYINISEGISATYTCGEPCCKQGVHIESITLDGDYDKNYRADL